MYIWACQSQSQILVSKIVKCHRKNLFVLEFTWEHHLGSAKGLRKLYEVVALKEWSKRRGWQTVWEWESVGGWDDSPEVWLYAFCNAGKHLAFLEAATGPPSYFHFYIFPPIVWQSSVYSASLSTLIYSLSILVIQEDMWYYLTVALIGISVMSSYVKYFSL